MEKEELYGRRIHGTFDRPGPETLEALRGFDTSNLCDGMGNGGAMHSQIKPLIADWKIAGPAVTVRLPIGDSLLISEAVELAREGDVIVVDAHGCMDNAVWGDLKCLACKVKKLAGVVIDGAVRDIEGIREIGFPVFARSVTCRSSSKNNPGEINVPVSCGGVAVQPGDIVVGDEGGVVVVPPLHVGQIVANVRKKMAWQEQMKGEILAGKFVTENFLKQMESLGYHL